MKNFPLIALLVLLPCEKSAASEPTVFGYRIVNVYPHDKEAFTQGLFMRDGWLYESTGLRGSSSIRKVRLDTGLVAQQHDLADQYFGEGIVDWNDSLIAVTWHSGQCFVFAIDAFVEQDRFKYVGEGWGLTRSDSHLILSDGTPILRFLNPQSFKTEKTISVTINGQAVRNLNELEWVKGEIFANVWRSDWIVRINPGSGAVTGLVDLSGLLTAAERAAAGTDVLNGIAYDSNANRIFVTGKNWPKLFEIELVERDAE